MDIPDPIFLRASNNIADPNCRLNKITVNYNNTVTKPFILDLLSYDLKNNSYRLTDIYPNILCFY
jgi:hypothetical protein